MKYATLVAWLLLILLGAVFGAIGWFLAIPGHVLGYVGMWLVSAAERFE